MAGGHGARIRDDAVYAALLRQGASAEKAARIANATANGSLEHRSTRLEERTRADLYRQAGEIGIAGRSGMKKDDLVRAIRDHG